MSCRVLRVLSYVIGGMFVFSVLSVSFPTPILADDEPEIGQATVQQQTAVQQQTLAQEATLIQHCLCARSGVGTNASFCATLTGSCVNMLTSTAFLDLTEAQRTALTGYTCALVTPDDHYARRTSDADTPHVCPNEPYDGLNVAAETISPTPPTPTRRAAAPLTSITPVLGVPIPGLTFSPATFSGGVTEVPFLAQYISAIQRYLIGLSVTAAVIMIVYGGFLYLLGSSIGEIGKGKNIITDAIVGLLFVLGAYTILAVINPNTLKLDALKFVTVEPDILGSDPDEMSLEDIGGPLPTTATANSGQPLPGSNPGPAPHSRDMCGRPGFLITSFSDFHGSIDPSAQTVLQTVLGDPIRLARYQTAGARQGVPWQVLLAIHVNEGSARVGGSIINGGPLCNTSDSGCAQICRVPSPENDIMCGAFILAHKQGPFTITNVNQIKRSVNNYIGYTNDMLTCPEASVIGVDWNTTHNDTVEQIHSCVPADCRGDCITDYTNGSRPAVRGCCTITVWSEGSSHPQTCNNGQGPRTGRGTCEVARDGDRRTFQYNRGANERTRPRTDPGRNPCGTWRIRTRTGHLAMIAWILQHGGAH